MLTNNERNIYTHKWILLHPQGPTAEFKEYYDNMLSPMDRKVPLLFTVCNVEAKYMTAELQRSSHDDGKLV